LTVVAFLLGIQLGAEIKTTARAGPEPVVTDTAVASPAPSAEPRAITLPASCRQALDQAEAALSTAEGAVDALRHLQTARLQRLLDDLQKARPQLDLMAARCRRETGTAG
jgi:hypothetical protein